ncbi:MAG: prolyl oligopeptidase family serine peptidase [Calditrichaeota bacterium]|nr:prolyl oligopeptidase family serine peptidase [Calditrichota bacterium]
MENGWKRQRRSVCLVGWLVLAASVAGSAQGQKLGWHPDFRPVEIASSVDSAVQKAYFYSTRSAQPRPLLVSLHTWSYDWQQPDSLAELARRLDWNVIHPDFRGPNRTVDACLSRKALSDIDDAIRYALAHARVDTDNIFVAGVSGGGYATLGAYMALRHRVRAFLAWASISDLEAWYYQCVARGRRYAQDVLRCTGSDRHLDVEAARRRSPLYWPVPRRKGARLEIYAGIQDGYTGSVPISHSILFFNRLAREFREPERQITQSEIVGLLTRGLPPRPDSLRIQGRLVYVTRAAGPVRLTIFDGGHEMLASFCLKRMRAIASGSDWWP